MAARLPLSPQEAYYWVYSLHPDWSYFDHPPLTAYTIGFFTYFLGDSAWAVRLGALLYSSGFTLLLFLIGRDLFNARAGFWAAALGSFLPTYAITALIITPNSPLLFFWTLAAYLSLQAVRRDRFRAYPAAGLALGLALLSKYTALFFPLSLGLFLLISAGHRHHWKRWELYCGLLIALLVFSPVLIWNARHDWASFAFQSTDRARELGGFSWRDFGAFWASQLGVITPLVMAGVIAALVRGLPASIREKNWEEWYLLSLSLPMIGLFTGVATREWVKINWLIPAYWPLILLLVVAYRKGLLGEGWVRKSGGRWTWISVLALFLALHLWPFFPQIKVSGSLDTLTGWEALADHLKSVQGQMPRPKDTFILAWGHKTAAELDYHLKGHAPVVAQTALSQKALAYDYWFDPGPLRGRDALFVWSEFENFPNTGSGLLQQFFEGVAEADSFTVYRGSHPLRKFRVYRCTGYRGFDFKRP